MKNNHLTYSSTDKRDNSFSSEPYATDPETIVPAHASGLGQRGAGNIDRHNQVIELLSALVRTPSLSGQEQAVTDVLSCWARKFGQVVTVDDAGLRIVVEGKRPGRTLLFTSHLDTVPAGDGWSVDPFAGLSEGGLIRGRGAVDAKASVAAMTAAAVGLADRGGPEVGQLVVLFTFSEETRDTTMPEALRRLGVIPDAAIIGEPTSLSPCIAQRGQLLLRLHFKGEQMHAAWAAHTRPAPTNAIMAAAEGLLVLSTLRFERVHQTLGEIVVTPTLAHAGVARNVTPPYCDIVLDIRTTPLYTHGEIITAIRTHLDAEVEIISDRLVPVETPLNSLLLSRFLCAHPEKQPIVSPTCSDWVFLGHVDAVKLGPGQSRLSHTPEEAIETNEVINAVELYGDICKEYLQ